MKWGEVAEVPSGAERKVMKGEYPENPERTRKRKKPKCRLDEDRENECLGQGFSDLTTDGVWWLFSDQGEFGGEVIDDTFEGIAIIRGKDDVRGHF